jgi:hypothetical protein
MLSSGEEGLMSASGLSSGETARLLLWRLMPLGLLRFPADL